MTPSVDVSAYADELAEARRDARTIAPFSARPEPLGLADGYAVAAELNRRAKEEGRLPRGWKGGLTDRSVWSRLGISEPIWGVLWEDRITSTSELEVGGLVQPRIEGEIAFGLAGGRLAVDAIEWVAPAFEIVQCHYDGWQFSAADGVADFCLHEALVIGEQVPVAEVDLALLKSLAATMRRNDDDAVVGSGANVMGDPLAVVTWMGSTEAQAAVPTGRVITTGALAGAHPLEPGERWRLTFEGAVLPSLVLELE